MYAVVDLETTGGNPGSDKIIEIAVYIHDGVRILNEYSRLVNPGVQIPFFISRLTGISDEMVSTAPSFEEIAEEVYNFLGDHIFVAHNVNFDYSFLSYALTQAGFPYEKQMLCTCKTSRVLFPGHISYSLSKICTALSIELVNAHRAAADAKATAMLLDLLLTKAGGVLDPFYSSSQKRVNKSNIPDALLEKIPSKAGVLYFYDEFGNVLYVSAASNLRKKAHFIINKMHTRRYSGLATMAVSVDFEITGGVLLSAIKEIEAVSQLQPRFNRKFNSIESRYSIYENLNDQGYLVLEKEKYRPGTNALLTFPSENEAGKMLQNTISKFELLSSEEIKNNNELLFKYDRNTYNERVTIAIDELSKQKKNFIITDRGPVTDHQSMVVIEDGKYTGYIFADREQSRAAISDLLEMKKSAADHSTVFKSIVKHVSQGKYQKIINF